VHIKCAKLWSPMHIKTDWPEIGQHYKGHARWNEWMWDNGESQILGDWIQFEVLFVGYNSLWAFQIKLHMYTISQFFFLVTVTNAKYNRSKKESFINREYQIMRQMKQ
jgi:hypothetical protein